MKKGYECLIFLALAAILIVLILQFVMMKSQRDLLEDSLIPNKPVIDIWDSNGPLLAYKYDGVMGGNPSVKIDAMNIGKMTIPWLNISFEETEYFQENWAYPDRIQNLPPMQNSTLFFGFRVKPEVNDSIPLGIHEFKFKITCSACKEQQTYDSFKICLYDSDPSIDCGSVWS